MPTCSQPKCRFAETGICLEGHKSDCPHIIVGAEDLEPGLATTHGTVPAAVPAPFRFHSGEKLTLAEASRLMNNVPAKVILCVGAQRAGKTTFLARIGELFRKGAFQDIRFVGSKTLCAFERLTWLATISSGAPHPETLRSHRAERDTFLHLRVEQVGYPKFATDLLISDLPGESFPTTLANREFCAEQRALARADHIVVFIDCQSLIDNAKRHAERDNTKLFLSQVKKVKYEPMALQVHIVFSRWDFVALHENRPIHEEFCNSMESDIRKCFGTSFGALHFSQIAARPKMMAGTDDEVQALFTRWMGALLPDPPIVSARISEPKRDFSSFGRK